MLAVAGRISHAIGGRLLADQPEQLEIGRATQELRDHRRPGRTTTDNRNPPHAPSPFEKEWDGSP